VSSQNVLDSSALLAFLQGEPGALKVEAALQNGAVCGAANWSEVAQKVLHHGASWELSRGVLANYGLAVEPVTQADAEAAAAMWPKAPILSLADRLCLALADRLDATALTADRAWLDASERVRTIR
jgi:PIN domain nuclease of toxin-antitoxin system